MHLWEWEWMGSLFKRTERTPTLHKRKNFYLLLRCPQMRKKDGKWRKSQNCFLLRVRTSPTRLLRSTDGRLRFLITFRQLLLKALPFKCRHSGAAEAVKQAAGHNRWHISNGFILLDIILKRVDSQAIWCCPIFRWVTIQPPEFRSYTNSPTAGRLV